MSYYHLPLDLLTNRQQFSMIEMTSKCSKLEWNHWPATLRILRILQSFEHFDVTFMVNKIYRPWKIVDLLFTLLQFWHPFLLKFFGKLCRRKERNKITSPSLHFYGVYSYWVWSKRKGNNVCRINVYQLVAVKNHFVAHVCRYCHFGSIWNMNWLKYIVSEQLTLEGTMNFNFQKHIFLYAIKL